MHVSNKKVTKRYLVKDAETGEQIYTNYSIRPQLFSTRQTNECDTRLDTTASSWGGDMVKATQSMSKRYGKPVVLVEDGEVEYFDVSI